VICLRIELLHVHESRGKGKGKVLDVSIALEANHAIQLPSSSQAPPRYETERRVLTDREVELGIHLCLVGLDASLACQERVRANVAPSELGEVGVGTELSSEDEVLRRSSKRRRVSGCDCGRQSDGEMLHGSEGRRAEQG
jgi:hypothetical protein